MKKRSRVMEIVSPNSNISEIIDTLLTICTLHLRKQTSSETFRCIVLQILFHLTASSCLEKPALRNHWPRFALSDALRADSEPFVPPASGIETYKSNAAGEKRATNLGCSAGAFVGANNARGVKNDRRWSDAVSRSSLPCHAGGATTAFFSQISSH